MARRDQETCRHYSWVVSDTQVAFPERLAWSLWVMWCAFGQAISRHPPILPSPPGSFASSSLPGCCKTTTPKKLRLAPRARVSIGHPRPTTPLRLCGFHHVIWNAQRSISWIPQWLAAASKQMELICQLQGAETSRPASTPARFPQNWYGSILFKSNWGMMDDWVLEGFEGFSSLYIKRS